MNSLIRTLAAIVLLTAQIQAADAPRAGVLVDDSLPVLGGAPALQPFKAASVLRRYGVEVVEFSATDLADAGKLNAARIPVLVLWNGNAFPQPALANLRAFHAAGGSLVTSGVPFTHPCELRDRKWTDLGHRDAFSHTADRMGTGGFGGPGKSDGTLLVPQNQLGLKPEILPASRARLQWFEPGKLPAEDSVIPLIQLRTADGKTHNAAAILRHECADFRGARDIWLGQIAAGAEEADRYLASQMLVRGVLWLLRDRKLLGDADWLKHIASLDEMKPPVPLPAGLAYRETPRPWGDTFLPKSKAPARHLFAVQFDKLSPAERIAVTCLQGLTSREQPRIWLLRNAEDRRWLEWHKTKGHIDSFEIVADWMSLFRDYGGNVRGAIIADPQLYRGDLLAVNVAACEDCIVASPEFAAKLGLRVKLDLRGKFATYAEGQRWVWKHYKDRLSHHLADYFVPRRMKEGTHRHPSSRSPSRAAVRRRDNGSGPRLPARHPRLPPPETP